MLDPAAASSPRPHRAQENIPVFHSFRFHRVSRFLSRSGPRRSPRGSTMEGAGTTGSMSMTKPWLVHHSLHVAWDTLELVFLFRALQIKVPVSISFCRSTPFQDTEGTGSVPLPQHCPSSTAQHRAVGPGSCTRRTAPSCTQGLSGPGPEAPLQPGASTQATRTYRVDAQAIQHVH